MDDEVKNLLKKNLEVGEESLRVLRKLYHDVWWRSFFGFAKWVIIVVLFVVGFLQLQPLIGPFLDNYQNILKLFEQVNTPLKNK
ncbi:MAG: hypothetical protein UW93_C0003G0014 [Parcubacteria group bacterium GW2011_GWC1_45_13]|uniref:Uncharacterized protein n=2 Tax=Candidatus Giovannoniibacteriota TaxID=1752738 RepID=A0A0G1LWP3_9BACT|nr:MAG: hypothetical protein UW49_C0002G0014 [Candidatus Giovannonibacteria bacterium GW2011_GWB1_44_23]KKT64134.1 MAG: hypothetical protein UW57_C0002G0014 [Candidatus Giovannonibacteria bacterium GW2011_GWA1_44_29]KKT91734.1 MAG: hypothetical protein UW93_C0003G0014 [Parcubacteria group bacterium GW2011_GWC1_45_13]